MANILIRSYQQILGSMAGRLLAVTELNDLAAGSKLLTTLEAAAASDLQIESKLLQLLNLKNIDKATGKDLENLAFELGLDPVRIQATPTSVYLTITETSFTKVYTNVYAGAGSPVAGDQTLKVVSSTGFTPTGTIYIGRGTNTSEVVNYVSITNSGTYSVINLAAPLQKDHLVGEQVVLGQGGKRTVNSGQVAYVPGVGLSPAIEFTVQQSASLEDGEDTLTNILAIASLPGLSGRVGIKKINSFRSAPWSTAAVTNPNAASGGSNIETDPDLRQRIKDHAHALSGGTPRAIISGVIGVIDNEENKRVVSAYLRLPTTNTDPTILFIDDGTGFQPSFSGIGEEVVVDSATGGENFLQLQKWPLVRSQVASVGLEYFNLLGGESLYVEVDGTSEEKVLAASNYKTPGVVSAQEVAQAINSSFTTIEARAKDGQLFIMPIANDPDYIKVGAATLGNDLNAVVKFPTTKQYTLRLYKNDILLEKNGLEAIAQSLINSAWTGILSPATSGNPETLQLNVDGIDSPVVPFTDLDFATYTSSSTAASGTVNDWSILINKKFIGVTATPGSDGTFSIKSNRGFSDLASIAIIGGSLATKLFPANTSSIGKSSQYSVNRELGQIQLTNNLVAGDRITAGTTNTRGFVETAASASYNLSVTGSSAPEIVFIADYPYTDVLVAQTGTVTFASLAGNTTKITGAAAQFSSVNVNDCVHLWGSLPRVGLLRVVAVASDGSSVTLADPNPASGSAVLDGVNNKIRFFRTSGVPQLLTGISGASVSNLTIQAAITAQIQGITAVINDDQSILLTTNRYTGTGALGIPSITGTYRNLGISEGNYYSNDPQIASVESADLTGIPSKRLTISNPDNTAPYDDLNVNLTPFTFENNNTPILTYLGANEKIIRQPEILNSTSDLTLRDDFVNQSVGLCPDMHATTLSGLEVGQADNMVFLVDNNPSMKTFDIPMYVQGTISGPSVPTTNQFDILDSTGASMSNSSRWTGYRWRDYKLWFQAKGVLNSSGVNSSIDVVSNFYGKNGEKIQLSLVYPSQAASPLVSALTVDAANDIISIVTTLSSGNAKSINLAAGSYIQVTPSSGQMLYTFLPQTDLSQVAPGDIINLTDSQFQTANLGPANIFAVNSLVDNGNAYQFNTQNTTGDVNGAVNITLSAAPTQGIQVGDILTIGSSSYAVVTVNSPTSVVVASPGFTDGSAQNITIAHKAITASNTPVFTVSVGDKIVVGSNIMTVTGVIDSKNFNVDNPFSFSGLVSGTASRINLYASKATTGTSEIHYAQSSASAQVYQASQTNNTANKIIASINGTAGIKDLVTASNSAGSDGSGIIAFSTQDSSGQPYVSLVNGENYIYDTYTTSPGFQLKQAATQAPAIGDKVLLIPATPQNVSDHFNKKQISGLSIAANIALVDEGRRVQVSSLIPGGAGQVFAIGGRASGNSYINVRGNVQEISASRAQVELDKSGIDSLAPGFTVKFSQSGRAKKDFTAAQPTSSTTLQIQVPAVGVGKFIFGVPLVTIYPYAQTGSAQWAVRNIGRNRIRFEVLSGMASVPSTVNVDDFVLIGNGSSYAGITTDTAFAPANQGWFQIRETDNSTYFDVDGQGIDQFVNTSATSFIFTSYHSARPGDQLVIGADAPVVTGNKGTFLIASVPDTSSVTYSNANVATQASVVLGTAGVNSISILDQGYTTYRKVVMVAPKPSDPANRSILTVSPGTDLGLINEGQGAQITLPNRLNYGQDPVPGSNGYNYWTGLTRTVSRILSGYQVDIASYPGVAAAGISVEPRPPQIQQVSVALKIKTSKGISLQSISDTIKSAIDSYVNSLGLGEDVILSEIVTLVQEVPGVESCILTSPSPTTDRISVADKAVARISANNITLS